MIDIKKLIEDSDKTEGQPVLEVEFNEVIFQVGFLTTETLRQLRDRCITRKYDKKLRAAVETLDAERFNKQFAKLVIRGWKNLTVDKLSRFMFINMRGLSEEQRKADVPYDVETARLLLTKSVDLHNFVTDVCTDTEQFSLSTKKLDDEEEEEADETFDPEDSDDIKN